jgi:hypothetical protein
MYCLKEKKGHSIIESRMEGRTRHYHLICQKCGYESWRSDGFLKGSAKCPNCSGGRHNNNARGYGDDPLWKRYWIIKRRLKRPEYAHLSMCAEWENDFPAFRAWALANGYREDLTIDRIDNSKGYYTDNCRWVDAKQQANNRRSNVILEYQGNGYTLAELADYCGLSRATVKQRYKNGWSVEDIVRTPHKARKKWSERQAG